MQINSPGIYFCCRRWTSLIFTLSKQRPLCWSDWNSTEVVFPSFCVYFPKLSLTHNATVRRYFSSPLYLGVIVWIRRDCIYPDSWVASWRGNKWPDNQRYSDPSQHRNKNKKIITCFRQAYPAMSHEIKRDIFRKTQRGEGFGWKQGMKMKEGMKDREMNYVKGLWKCSRYLF